MKLFLLFFLLVFSTSLFAQLPEGYFSDRSYLPAGEEFYFGKNNSFSYSYDCGDCGSKAGSGVYTVSHDTLALHFQPACRIEAVRVLDDFFEVNFPGDSISYSVTFAPDSGLQFLLVQLCTGNGTNLRNFAVKGNRCFFSVSKAQADSCYLHISSAAAYSEDWIPLKTLPRRAKITLAAAVHFEFPPWTICRFRIFHTGRHKIVLLPLVGTMTFNAGNKKGNVYYRGRLRS